MVLYKREKNNIKININIVNNYNYNIIFFKKVIINWLVIMLL